MAKKKGINVKIHDISKGLPYDSGYFDAIFAGEIIEHMTDDMFFLAECKRILKKNGILLLTTPNLVSLRNRIRKLFGPFSFWS